MVRPGLAVDEMQHPVMGAAEAVVGEDPVGIADEIAIGEEQQFDQVVGRPLLGEASCACRLARARSSWPRVTIAALRDL